MSFDLALAAERQLNASLAVRRDVYERLTRAVEALLPLHAFYVCLYQPRMGTLRFEYNGDDDRVDPPETFPLGQGPTSVVVKTGKSLVFNHRRNASLSVLRFGGADRPARSG